ncbi:hypothetical protein D3C84_830720 [compost metagenome]
MRHPCHLHDHPLVRKPHLSAYIPRYILHWSLDLIEVWIQLHRYHDIGLSPKFFQVQPHAPLRKQNLNRNDLRRSSIALVHNSHLAFLR